MAVLADAQKRRFLAPHYVANAALLATYALVRLNFRPSDPAAPGRQGRINTLEQLHVWEKQAALVLGAVVVFRVWRRRSWDQAAQQVLFYAKVVVALVAAMVDARLAAWYALAAWAIYALLPQPIIDLTASGNVASLTPATLREASTATDCAWMVFFYTQSQPSSVAAAPAFLQVADEFASAKLRFGAFDVAVWPRTAGELRLTTNTWSGALPAVVMFDKAKEWGRLPPPESPNDPARRSQYTRADIVRLFRLEERFGAPLDAAGVGGKKGQ